MYQKHSTGLRGYPRVFSRSFEKSLTMYLFAGSKHGRRDCPLAKCNNYCHFISSGTLGLSMSALGPHRGSYNGLLSYWISFVLS